MYLSIKENWIEEDEARKIAGDELVDEALAGNCQFTNRVIDDCFGVQEMSFSAENDTHRVTVYYLITKEEIELYEDMGSFDYSDYYFDVEEL